MALFLENWNFYCFLSNLFLPVSMSSYIKPGLPHWLFLTTGLSLQMTSFLFHEILFNKRFTVYFVPVPLFKEKFNLLMSLMVILVFCLLYLIWSWKNLKKCLIILFIYIPSSSPLEFVTHVIIPSSVVECQ